MTYPSYIVMDTTEDKRCTAHIEETEGLLMARIIENRRVVEGDALLIADRLKDAGFEFGEDFYVKKVKKCRVCKGDKTVDAIAVHGDRSVEDAEIPCPNCAGFGYTYWVEESSDDKVHRD